MRLIESRLGADISGSQFLLATAACPEPLAQPRGPGGDGVSASRATSASGADLGVVFDTAVDRSAVIDASGVAFNRNRT